MGVKGFVKQVLTEQQNRKYARLMAAKTVSYDSWIREQEKNFAWKLDKSLTCKQGTIYREGTACEQEADVLRQLTQSENDEFVCFVMPGGRLATGALRRIAQCFAECPDASILYGDEDIMENAEGEEGSSGLEIPASKKTGVRRTPWFKPDWSPDLFSSAFYFGSMVAMRKSLWEQERGDGSPEKTGLSETEKHDKGIVYEIVDVSRFHMFIRDCVVAAGGYKKNSKTVLHVPEILFHCNNEDAWEYCKTKEIYYSGKSGEDNIENKLLSIVIPSKDNPEILKKCLHAIPAAAGALNYEVIVVDNGSNEENRQKIEALIHDSTIKDDATQEDAIKDDATKENAIKENATKDSAIQDSIIQDNTISYIYAPREFHFSKMCNQGAEVAKGDLLLFLNDDVELIQAGSLEKLAELAVQEYTGAVGIKLYYPDSIKIQHAGITNLPMGPVHKLQFLEDDKEYYFGYNRGCRNVLAVTAACLMVEKEKFRQVGGFAEELRVAFNDVDFCLQLHKAGYFNVCRNDCFAYHHESLSRGDDESSEKLSRLLGELHVLFERNHGMFARDPYYGAGLGREGLDTKIRPAYETAGNQIQKIKGTLRLLKQEEYRRDNCLLFRVEEESDAGILGYGVVLGDNNACYDRWLVFKRIEKTNTLQEMLSTKRGAKQPAGTICVAIEVDGQYRPDLVENLPDQMNVGLCGYWVRLETGSLPEGEYRIGMAARNRVTGLQLINWSNRTMTVRYRTEQ